MGSSVRVTVLHQRGDELGMKAVTLSTFRPGTVDATGNNFGCQRKGAVGRTKSASIAPEAGEVLLSAAASGDKTGWRVKVLAASRKSSYCAAKYCPGRNEDDQFGCGPRFQGEVQADVRNGAEGDEHG